MKKILSAATRALVAAAGGRAKSVMRKQAAATKPYTEEYRSNAGGWN
ncbi:hypothetical protein [Massilia sp.]|nr:hypothetical protein [Massilia sp.]